ncbi:MAG: hypothetical protein P3T54_05330 [Dehalogenimonas sp.]|uniref:TM2 domain-containing protein n=1 Tax=Candidatus Dehalogenimonas loeffleri TaxID=3127115 RepID=A0ABZ2J2A7_9CHLR|nr:hypothetical protein [Dehalogenimonas sp.]
MKYGLGEIILIIALIGLVGVRVFLYALGSLHKKESGKYVTSKGTIHIPKVDLDRIPTSKRVQIETMPIEKQVAFLDEYLWRTKNLPEAYLHWAFFGMHYTYLVRDDLQFRYWLTLGGLLVWAVIDLFRMPEMVMAYNLKLVDRVLKELG